MASQVPPRLLEEISEALRASPDAAQLRAGLISSIQYSFFARTDAAKVDISDSEKYLTCFLGALGYALSPSLRSRRTNFASAVRINTGDMARNWFVTQDRTNVSDEQRTHARSLTKIADIFSRAFTVMGNCRSPLYISSEKADAWIDIWRLINGQRMSRSEWSFSGSSTEQEALRPTLAPIRTVAERNHARSRRRFLRARYLNSQVDTVDVWEDETHHVGLPRDESLPAERLGEPLYLPEYSPLPLSSLGPRLTVRPHEAPSGRP